MIMFLDLTTTLPHIFLVLVSHTVFDHAFYPIAIRWPMMLLL